MPLGRRVTTRGGHRAGPGAQPVQWGRPKRHEVKLVGTSRGSSSEVRECPTCHRDVGVRMDGSIRNHRVGTDRQHSWPCPGEERPA